MDSRYARSDCREILKYGQKFFEKQGYFLPTDFGLEWDHVIPQSFANTMHISHNQGMVVLVPKFVNARRTNTLIAVDDFTNFDWRLSQT